MTRTLDIETILADFAASLAAMGLSEHLKTARDFARDGVSADELYNLMRGNFPKPVIFALIGEAWAAKQKAEPVIR